MKIMFDASVRGRNEFEKNYEAILSSLEDLGHDVSAHVLEATKANIQMETEEEAAKYYEQLKKWIKKADLLIFEVSYPSLGIGHEITWGLNLNKPVIVMHVKGKRPVILDTVPNDKLQIIEYNLRNVKREIKDAIDYAVDQQDTRFNFFISPKHQNYLDWVAKNRKVPRAVFLRNLIEKHMEKNEEYS